MQLDDMSSAQRLAMDEAMSGAPLTLVPPPSPTPSADDILDMGKAILAQRGKQYDVNATAERGMSKVVAAFNALEGTQLTEVQGWRFMVLLKLMRSAQGAPHLDNYVDGQNYFALAGEAAMKESV